jgi:hypothetical protein
VNQPIKNIYGYDYVLDLNFTNFSYSVYLIDSDTDLLSGSLRQNDEANPWRYYDGGTLLGAEYQNVSFSYMTGLSDADVGGLLGDSHNAVIVDLSFLGESTEFTAHFTMQCTNDNLMGKGIIASESSVIPEPSTILLLGIGLIGTVAFMRKQGKKFIQ